MIHERQQAILQILGQTGEVSLQQLKVRFPDVSMMTLRRDLTFLETEGHLIRTHGGAVSAQKLSAMTGEEDAYSRRATDNPDAKRIISEKALKFVDKGRSMYFDAGSTVMMLARSLPDDAYSVLTSGTNIALELVKKPSVQVVTLGGLLNRNTLSVSGPHAVSLLDIINIDIAFMSASGYSMHGGFTVSNAYECELKRKVVAKARQVIMLVDSKKIDRNMPFTFATLDQVDAWITEGALSEAIVQEAANRGVEIL